MGATRVFSIVRVELRRFLRERSNVFFVFVLPLALVLFIGLQFGGSSGTPLGVVVAADDAARALVDDLDGADGLSVVEVGDEDELLSMVSRGTVSAGVVIGDGYSAALTSGESFEIGFVARPDQAGASLRTVVEAAIAEQTAAPDAARTAADVLDAPVGELLPIAEQIHAELAEVTVRSEAVGGDALAEEFAGMGQFELGASSQLFLFVFLTSLAGSAALIQTRQYGVASRMLSTPTRLPVLLAGLGGGRLAVALFQAIYIIVVTAVVFGVDWGDWRATGALLLVFSIVSAGAGMLLGAVVSNDAQASGAGVGIGLVMAALGGSMMPLDFFPDGMRTVALFTPHGWANTAMAEVLRRGGGIADIAVELGVLSAMAVVVVTLATVALRRAITA